MTGSGRYGWYRQGTRSGAIVDRNGGPAVYLETSAMYLLELHRTREADLRREMREAQRLGAFHDGVAHRCSELVESIGSHADVHGDPRRLALECLGSVGPVAGQVEASGPLEPLLGGADADHARDPVRPDLAAVGARDDVPDAGLQDESERLDHAASGSTAAVVFDGDARRIPDGIRQLRQVWHGLAGVEPFARVKVEPLDQSRGTGAQLGRERGQDLELRSRDDRAEPELRGGTREAGKEQGLGLLAGHPRQPRPIAVHQPDAAMGAAFGVDRDGRRTQRFDLAVDRPFRDLELGRELAGRQLAARLEEEQQRDETGRTHAATLTAILPVRVK